jgi:DNA-binding MarR family transcriptional regulator
MSGRRASRTIAPRIGQLLGDLPAEGAILPDSIGLHIRLAQLGMFREFQRIFHGTGLTPSVHAMLTLIRENPGIRQGALADALVVCSPNIAAAIASLEEARLVRRKVDKHDRRALCVRLTPRGEQLLLEAQDRVHELEQRLFRGFRDEELDQLRQYLRRILDSMA